MIVKIAIGMISLKNTFSLYALLLHLSVHVRTPRVLQLLKALQPGLKLAASEHLETMARCTALVGVIQPSAAMAALLSVTSKPDES